MDIRKIIREEVEKLFEDKVVLKSKSDKGNRLFKQLKTAKFQHYDMPKGELVSFSYGEEDRKRLVSKLSKEDKKIYRAWVKTPEGEKSMKIWDGISRAWKKRFPDSKKNLNEVKYIVDKFGDKLMVDKNWAGLNIPVSQYKTRVKDSLVHTITRDKGISEKSFSEYDHIISDVANFFKINEEANSLIIEFEKNESRPEYVAEKIYEELYRNYLNEAKKKKNPKKRNTFKNLQDNKVALTKEERAEVMKKKAVWYFSPGNKPSPAVWKSKHPKTGKITYVTHTHRAYNTAPTLKGAIGRFHDFIKSTS